MLVGTSVTPVPLQHRRLLHRSALFLDLLQTLLALRLAIEEHADQVLLVRTSRVQVAGLPIGGTMDSKTLW